MRTRHLRLRMSNYDLEMRPGWREFLRSPWTGAFCGSFLGSFLAWVCMVPWVVETVKIVQAMWFR